MLDELVRWWLRQMLDLLPPGWRTGAGTPRRALVIDCGADLSPVTATCLRRRGRREVPVGTVALAPGRASPRSARPRDLRPRVPVVLRVAAKPLECEVALPLAAETAMHQVLQAEMDRLTPFAASDVFWNAALRSRDQEHGRVHAMLSLVPRAALAPLLAALERYGLVPDMLETAQPDGMPCCIPLRPPRRRLLPLVAGTVAAILLLAGGLATPFLLQDREAATLQQRIADLQPRVDRVQALRRRHVAAREVSAAALVAEWHRVGDAMQVLATLTDLLPDDTHLTMLSLRQRKLTISGQSAAAARLIVMLSSGSLIRDPAFAAPVVRDPSSQADTFSLRAEIAP